MLHEPAILRYRVGTFQQAPLSMGRPRMRTIIGVLAALSVSAMLSSAHGERRVVLTDYCPELELLREVTRPGLSVRSQAAILARAMQHPRFRGLVEAHGDQHFSVSEINTALRLCQEGGHQAGQHQAGRRWDADGKSVLWGMLALPVAIVAVLCLIDARRNRSQKSAKLKSSPRHVPDWERNDTASRRRELRRLRDAIEDRS